MLNAYLRDQVGNIAYLRKIVRSCSFCGWYKSEDRMGKKDHVWFSGNGKGPHVSRSVIGPFLPGSLVESRAHLPLRAMGSM